MARRLRTTLGAGVPTHRDLTVSRRLRAVGLFQRCRDTCSRPNDGDCSTSSSCRPARQGCRTVGRRIGLVERIACQAAGLGGPFVEPGDEGVPQLIREVALMASNAAEIVGTLPGSEPVRNAVLHGRGLRGRRVWSWRTSRVGGVVDDRRPSTSMSWKACYSCWPRLGRGADRGLPLSAGQEGTS